MQVDKNFKKEHENKSLKKKLQSNLLLAYKRGYRILDILMEYQRIYKLDSYETSKLINKNIKEKMFQQEKQYKTVVTKQTRHLVPKKKPKLSEFDLD